MQASFGMIFVGASLALGACSEHAPAETLQSHRPTTNTGNSGRPTRSLILAPEPLGASVRPPAHYDLSMGHHGDAYFEKPHVGSFAWTDEQWRDRCRGIRTSYNPDHDLSDSALTLRPGDPRWLDFVFWSLNNKVNEHQFEAFGGTGWRGPTTGVIFHWAPGSHWERDSLHSFGFVIGHIVGEHRWTDTMFPDFFEKYGGTYGINVKDRLTEIDARSKAPWVAFLDYIGGSGSPYFRYLLHIDAAVDLALHRIALTAGQGVAFNYSFDRYYDELAMILTDCSAFQFFQMYDRFGPGFAAEGNWANQAMPEDALSRVGYAGHIRYAPGLGSGGATVWSAEPDRPTRVEIPADLPDADRMKTGEQIYFRECVDCHGETGNGAGFLAEGFDVKPRDFRQAKYKFRSTPFGELPAMVDVERSIREGVAGTSMPAWGQFLTDREIGDVARYLVVFSPRFVAAWRDHSEPPRLQVTAVPSEVTELSLHPVGDAHPCGSGAHDHSYACEGEKLWHVTLCKWCHGDEGRGDGETARGMTDDWGNPVRPADLSYKWLFKNGYQPSDIYRSVFGGLNGTPMHSQSTFQGTHLSDHERWEIVGYVLSLSPATRPVLHLEDFAAQRKRRIDPNGRVVSGTLQETN
jgi:mono/diheme cytochrome c family protein